MQKVQIYLSPSRMSFLFFAYPQSSAGQHIGLGPRRLKESSSRLPHGRSDICRNKSEKSYDIMLFQVDW